jgi:hypothetical protein
MYRGRVVLAVVVVALFVILLARTAGPRTAADEPRPPADTDLSGKVLAVNTDSAGKVWSVLAKVEVRTLGGRSFLVGRGVDDGREGNYYKGRTLWIAVNRIEKMVEFANVQEFRKSSGLDER